MTTNTKNATESLLKHLEKYGDGAAVLNVFGIFKNEVITFQAINKLYKEKSVLIHPDKVRGNLKKRAVEAFNVLQAAREAASEFCRKRGRKEKTKMEDMIVSTNLSVLLNIEVQKTHIVKVANTSMDRVSSNFEDVEAKDDGPYIIYNMYREYREDLDNRSGSRWQLFDSDDDDVDDEIEATMFDIKTQDERIQAKKSKVEEG